MTDCKSPRDANQKASEGTNWSSALVLSEKNQISSEEQKKKKTLSKFQKWNVWFEEKAAPLITTTSSPQPWLYPAAWTSVITPVT